MSKNNRRQNFFRRLQQEQERAQQQKRIPEETRTPEQKPAQEQECTHEQSQSKGSRWEIFIRAKVAIDVFSPFGYDFDVFTENMNNVILDVRDGSIGEPQDQDEWVAAIVKENRLNLEAYMAKRPNVEFVVFDI